MTRRHFINWEAVERLRPEVESISNEVWKVERLPARLPPDLKTATREIREVLNVPDSIPRPARESDWLQTRAAA